MAGKRKKRIAGEYRVEALATVDAVSEARQRIGRPPEPFNQDTAAAIIDLMLEHGRSLHWVCQQNGIPSYGTVVGWMGRVPSFASDIARAREEVGEKAAAVIIDVMHDAKSEDAAADRVKLQAAQWLAERLKWQRYGPRQKVELEAKISLGDMISALDQVTDKGKTIEGTVNAAPSDIDAEPGEG